ncbi:MAG: response regulator [Verrucomicrobiota bacterium]
MKKGSNIQELRATKEQLLRSLNLFDLAAAGEGPEFLRRIDQSYVRELLGGPDLPWGEEGLYPDSARFIAGIRSSEEGQELSLSSDIELLRRLKDTGKEQAHYGPFGLLEAAFPVRVRGAVIHCLWSGKVREHSFTHNEISDLAKLSGLSRAEAEELAGAVPVLSKKQIDRAFAFCRRLCAGLEQALTHHLHATELAQQLIQSERTQSLGTLSGGVAHHFNNLLSIILGYSSFVLNREKISREATEALRKIMDAAQRGRRLTEEILAFLGSDTEEDVPCRIHETVSSVLSLLEQKTGSRVRVEVRLEAERDTVVASPSAIRQIVFNLLTNAIDSMPSGGVLTISTLNEQMATDSGQQEYLQLEVADTGGGVPAAVGVTADSERVGLKLSSVYGMVGRLDGTVVVSSDPGTVTRVKVLLPVAVGGVPARPERKARRKLAPSRIWVVDDDAIFREMCRQVLADDGHDVEEISGGRQFQDRWRKGAPRPDLILMDFSMPEYNGLQLCEWLRADGAKTPVILVSGFTASQPDIRKALRLKKTFFLQKPFSFREMADTVTVALGETLIGE